MADVNILHQGNQVNEQQVNAPRSRSRFDNSYKLALTARFGEYTPTFVAETNPKENHTLRNIQRVTSLNFKSPLLQDVKLKKDFFNVPLSCVLPFNWDKVYNNPTIGDDVNSDVNCVANTFALIAPIATAYEKLAALFIPDVETEKMPIEDMTLQEQEIITLRILQFIVALETIFSSGSLLNYLGCQVSDFFAIKVSDSPLTFTTVDKLCDTIYEIYSRYANGYYFVDGVAVPMVNPSGETDGDLHYFRDFLQHMRQNGLSEDDISGFYIDNDVFAELAPIFQAAPTLYPEFEYDADVASPLNLWRVFAYQLAVSHFYSNDSVDYVYSAELYRQNLRSLYKSYFEDSALNWTDIESFDYNGVSTPYDACSGKLLNVLCYDVYTTVLALPQDPWDYNVPNVYFNIIANIFSFRPSLRYVDYFTGSRTRPLAIGDTSVDVNTDSLTVDVVDVTRNIQIQRFLNAVNRSGRKIANYIRELFGAEVGYDYHDPEYLGHTSEIIYGEEVQNTGDAQQSQAISTTSILKGNSNNFAFEFSSDSNGIPSVLIGLTYFDIPRLYFRSTDRNFFHKDRFDMFNPFLEHVGDQPIYLREVSRFAGGWFSGVPSYDTLENQIFGYQGRYMEYKQRVSRAVGGFVENLPGFAFLADKDIYWVTEDGVMPHLSPDYIRSRSSELDGYFTVLTGFSLSSYFHFIVVVDNVLDSSRPMSYSPNIL